MRFISVSFFFNATPTTEIYTLSLHDALPILDAGKRTYRRRELIGQGTDAWHPRRGGSTARKLDIDRDRKSTRLNSSHANISYAVFCLKKKKRTNADRVRDEEGHIRE